MSRRFRIVNVTGVLRRAVRTRTLLALVVVLAFIGTMVGCESQAMRTFRGGRLYVSGTEALDRGETTLAIAQLDEAATLAPSVSEIRNHLGLAYWSAGDETSARSAFEAAIELDCDNEAARSNLARLEATAANAEGPGDE